MSCTQMPVMVLHWVVTARSCPLLAVKVPPVGVSVICPKVVSNVPVIKGGKALVIRSHDGWYGPASLAGTPWIRPNPTKQIAGRSIRLKVFRLALVYLWSMFQS